LRVLGEHDVAAALHFAAGMEGIQRVDVVAHSFSLMLFGMAPNRNLVKRLISVGSGSPHYAFQPFPRNLLYLFLWGIVVPRSARVHGYFPGKRLGLVGDMPEAVAREVAAACRRRGAFRAELQDWEGDLWAIGISDDEISPPAAVDEMHAGIARARMRHSQLSPVELGLKEIGHYGVFLPTSSAVWGQMASWLNKDELSEAPVL
jgi:predicted alpha/beta hydrolase